MTMVWITFTDDFNWRASKRGMVQYRKGQRRNVPRACAAEAEAAGVGHRDAQPAASDSGETVTAEITAFEPETDETVDTNFDDDAADDAG